VPQCNFDSKSLVEGATLLRMADLLDSIVAYTASAADFFNTIGQNEPSKHVRCGGSFRRKQSLEPFLGLLDWAYDDAAG
jgi:hypothetical protein